MATFTQLPGDLNIVGTRGDSITVNAVFPNRDLTGVSLSAVVYVPTEAGYTAQTPAATPTVTVVSASASGSHIKVTFSKTQTAALTSTTPYRWFLRETYADTTARATLAGNVTISSP